MNSPTSHIHSPLERLTKGRLLLITILLFIGIALLYFIDMSIRTNTGLADLDKPSLEWLTAWRTPPLTTFMQGITALMSPPVVVAVTILGACIWTWYKKEYWRPLLLISAVSGSFVISTTLKLLTTRTRPPSIDMILPLETGYSFPSNHTFGVAVCVLVLGYLLYSRNRSVYLLLSWVIIGTMSITLVSLSRMYLGYHWFTDVIASVALAIVILGLVVLIDTFKTSPSASRHIS
jgi:membrane-associated phospholipid phosphatase